ncbi:MAG: type II secretion system F family protein [Magnetovibrio sp.]|nr:type II secretion system F family protein [Magnetovibrio sp.]
MNDQTVLYIMIAAGASIFLLVLVGALVTAAMRPKMRLKKRIDSIGTIATAGNLSSKSDGRRQKRIQDRVKGISEEETEESIIDRITSKILQAGLNVETNVFLMICVGSGIATMLLATYIGYGIVVIIGSGIVGGAGLPKVVLGIMARRRQNHFTSHFAEAIDVITRGIRSGLPVGECLSIIAREFEGPLGEEFHLIVEGQRLGLTLDDILSRALKRIPTADFKFFAIVLQIQRQTGGNLADTLDNLSDVLRDRKRMKDKVQALSSEAKSSAAIIACLPFFVLGMLSLVNPAYVGLLFTDGIHLVYTGLGMMGAGVAVMNQMINFDI